MSELLDKIRSRGHWRVRIMPVDFDEGRISEVVEIERIIEKTFVQFRGWCFPHSGSQLMKHHKDDRENGWVGQETKWQHYVEFWRFYQSGQFIYYSGMKEDRQNQCHANCLYSDLDPGKALDTLDAVLRFTEIFEFAARLTFPPASYAQLHLEIIISGLDGRALWDRPGGMYLPDEHISVSDKWSYKESFNGIQLITDAKGLALAVAQDLFSQFGWKPSTPRLRDIQTELLRKSSAVGR